MRTEIVCEKCRKTGPQFRHMPFCDECVMSCIDCEIADHWCVIDQWRTDHRPGRASG